MKNTNNLKVEILAGKDKGKVGNAISLNKKRNTVIVEGINKARKAVKPSEQNRDGGYIDKPMPIHLSNIKIKN